MGRVKRPLSSGGRREQSVLSALALPAEPSRSGRVPRRQPDRAELLEVRAGAVR